MEGKLLGLEGWELHYGIVVMKVKKTEALREESPLIRDLEDFSEIVK